MQNIQHKTLQKFQHNTVRNNPKNYILRNIFGTIHCEIFTARFYLLNFTFKNDFLFIFQCVQVILPTRDQYFAFNQTSDLKKYSDTGDTNRVSMILQADASIKQMASYFSLGDLTADTSRANMTTAAGVKYDGLLRDLTNVRENCTVHTVCI